MASRSPALYCAALRHEYSASSPAADQHYFTCGFDRPYADERIGAACMSVTPYVIALPARATACRHHALLYEEVRAVSLLPY